MSTRVVLSLAMLTAASVVSAAEPPARVALEIGGTTVEVEAGQRFDILVEGKKQSARIKELPTRHFDEAGIRFEYPRHFSWEHDPPNNWTLDGNNAVLILTRGERDDGSSAKDVLDAVAGRRVGKRGAAYREISLHARQGHVEGLEATIDVGGFQIRSEAYVLARGDVFAILILQDSSDGDADDAVEFQDLRSRLAATLEF